MSDTDKRITGGTTMTDSDRFAELVVIRKRLAELGQEILELSEVRKTLVGELHAAGYSHGVIAAYMGVSRERVFQILRAEERAADPVEIEG